MVQKTLIANKGNRTWQGIPSIERTSSGRLWCTFFSGGNKEPEPENFILITSSSDDGQSWTEPYVVVGSQGGTRAYDPCLWIDPLKRMWLFYNTANIESQKFEIWAMYAEDPDADRIKWSESYRIDLEVPFSFRLNKPITISNGNWLLPVTWDESLPGNWLLHGASFNGTQWFTGETQLQGVAISQDFGCTWKLYGAVKAPGWALENMIVERKDKSLWMLIRNGSGYIWQSFSYDHGLTWTTSETTDIQDPGTRFFFRRVSTGVIILIHASHPKKRIGITLSISSDDRNFKKIFEIDESENISYPDAIEASNGKIYLVYDHDRYGNGEILMSVFPLKKIQE